MTTKNAMEMTAAEFDAAVRGFEHRDHWASKRRSRVRMSRSSSIGIRI